MSDDTIKTGGAAAPDAADRLGRDPIGELLIRFSIPAIAGMLVNALYNIVDRVFVGRGVNEVALGGIALSMPLMNISMAFAMLFGAGAANMISMRLGQDRREEAENTLNHCFVLLFCVSALFAAACLIFLDPLFSIMGAQEGSLALGYAKDYFRIITYGQIFSMVGFGLSHCTRAQGFPKITMAGMLIGAAMNAILDPIFIFIFGWGVEGAAWATIISQMCSMIWILHFTLSKKAVIRLNLRSFKPSGAIVAQMAAFGSSGFLMQLAASVVQFAYNDSAGRYGVQSLGIANGGDIALSGMNIVNSIATLILMPIFGINQGFQPIVGYNYGAGKFDRVKKAYIRAAGAASAICILGFILVMLSARQIVGLFSPDGSEALLRFTPDAMRVVLISFPINGFQIVSTNLFVATGRPQTATILSMLRQVIVLIPCILLFGHFWGINGMVAASPVSDFASFILTAVLVALELKKLNARGARL
ncbi:MAG: MATE family efflux transporter [Oscillospiraceae bacterium]|nr:MATE family efflux transporter [Oscillospiraceae bacterium]